MTIKWPDQFGRVKVSRSGDDLINVDLALEGDPPPGAPSKGSEWTLRDFEELVVGKHHEDVKMLVWAAGICGWKIKVLSPESLTLVASDGTAITISARRRPSRRDILKLIHKVYTHGDPLKVSLAEAYFEGGPIPDFTMEIEFEKHEPKERHPKPEPPVRVSPQPSAVPAKLGRHVVSEGPFMSHYSAGSSTSPGHRYPSQTIVERHWSDGTVDYRCALCDFHRDKMEGIRGHWQRHLRDGTAERAATDKKKLLVEDPEYTQPGSSRRSYTPRTARVLALAKFIKSLPKGSPEDLAQAVLEWIHEQSSTGSPLSAESEPLTDSEILERVRRLVDRGEYLDQVRELEEMAKKVDALYVEKEDLAQELQAAQREALRARESLDALHELTAEWANPKPIQ